LIGGERTSLRNIGVETMVEAIQLEYKEVRMLGDDVFIRAVPKPQTPTTKNKGDK